MMPLGLFGCTCIHVNLRVLKWIRVKIKLSFTLNLLQHIWIKLDTYASKQGQWSMAQNSRMFAVRGAFVTDHPTVTPNLVNLFGLISL